MHSVLKTSLRLTLAAALCVAATSQDGPADELLRRIDDAMGPSGAFRMDVSVRVERRDAPPLQTEFEMLADGRDRTLLKTLGPVEERGRNLLYEGRVVWAYLPTVRRPFQVSLTQRLTGEVSNGDIARTHFSRDYRILSQTVEAPDGRRQRRLSLQSKSMEVTYPKVTLWIDDETQRPLRAEYFAVSGRLLKRCSFEGYAEMFERPRPTRLVLTDALDTGRTSTIVYSKWKRVDIPPKALAVSALDKMTY